MTIPYPGPEPEPATRSECEWCELDAAGERERVLDAAGELFARQGLDASMPAVAAAAGAGVASVYRQFPSKYELLEWLHSLVERQPVDDLLGEARMVVAEHTDVISATDRATDAIEELLEAARAEGRLRADATTLDLELLFAATRAAKEVAPASWPRMLELLIDSLDTAADQ